LPGCEAAARAATEQFIAALVTGDGGAIASLMSPKAQGELLQAARRWKLDVATPAEAAARIWGGPWTALLDEVRVDDVRIDGDRATVTYSHLTYGRDEDDLFRLHEVDGRWLVDEFLDDHDDGVPPWAFSA
jgi:hypothetical protein